MQKIVNRSGFNPTTTLNLIKCQAVPDLQTYWVRLNSTTYSYKKADNKMSSAFLWGG